MPLELSDEFRINVNTANSQATPHLAGAKDGGFVCAWDNLVNPSPGPLMSQMRARKFDGSGNATTPELNINNTTHGPRFWCSFEQLKNGAFAFVWPSRSRAVSDVIGRIFDENLSPDGEEQLLGGLDTITQTYPSVAALNDGGFAVGWVQGQTTNNSVRVCVFDRLGRPISNINNVGFGLSRTIRSVKLTHVEDNKFAVIWTEERDNHFTLKGQVFNRRMIPLSPQFYVGNPDTSIREFDVSKIQNSEFCVVWEDNANTLGQRFKVNGSKAGQEIEVEVEKYLGSTRPTIAYGTNGVFLVAWTQLGAGHNVFARLHNSDGVPFGSSIQLSDRTAGNAHIAGLNNGAFVVAWQGYAEDNRTQDIFAKIVKIT